jgi:hypothetical protein
VPDTVDSFRQSFITQVMSSIDLTRYRISRRNFPITADKRTMNFEIVADEIPPMGDPVGATNARGTFSVRLVKGGGLSGKYMCSLRATYVIRPDWPRRQAWSLFTHLAWFRMQASQLARVAPINNKGAPAQNAGAASTAQLYAYALNLAGNVVLSNYFGPLHAMATLQNIYRQEASQSNAQRCIPVHFSLDEGLYRDSKTITFEVSWILMTQWSTLMRSCGVWRVDKNDTGGAAWAASVADIMGWRSRYVDTLVASQDAIVDLGT